VVLLATLIFQAGKLTYTAITVHDFEKGLLIKRKASYS